MRSKAGRFSIYSALIGLMVVTGTRANALSVGDPAPPLSIKEWVRGEPVDLKKDSSKRLHLVEFWATWCGPCKASVPLLTRYQQKYAKDLLIIGVTDPDPLRNSPSEIKEFVKAQGNQMAYTVAIDDGGRTTDAYMTSAGAIGIPHAFLVSKDGRIVWQGSPLDPELDTVVSKVLAGKYDVAAAKAEANKGQELDRKFEAVEFAYQRGRLDEVWSGVEDILKLDPANETGLQLLAGLYITEPKNAERYKRWVRNHIEAHRSDAKVMHALALSLATNEDFSTRLPDLTLEAAKAAYDAAQPRTGWAADIYARALYQIGDLDKAIAIQTEALSLASADEKEIAQATLDYYKQCKKLRTSP